MITIHRYSCKTSLTLCLSFLYLINNTSSAENKEMTDSIAVVWKTPIPYGTQNPESSTYATSTLKADRLDNYLTGMLTNGVMGEVTGVQAQHFGGAPGADGSVLSIRGFRTLSGRNGSPLILIDNMPGDFNNLDPMEIESITVLKDAAATAIYGQRGANGVLLVTTKRGEEGNLQIKFNAELGAQQLLGLPSFLDSYNYAQLYNEGWYNRGNSYPFYDANDLEKYKNPQGNDIYTHPDVDFVNQFLKDNALVQRYSLGLSGGNKIARYNVVLAYFDQGGFYKYAVEDRKYSTNASSKRYNLRTNLDIQLNKRLQIAANLAAQLATNRNPAAGTYNVWSTLMREAPNSYPVFTPSGNLGGTSNKLDNPVGTMSKSGYEELYNRMVQASVKATQQLDFILPGLSYNLAFSFDGINNYSYRQTQQYAVYALQQDPLSGEINEYKMGEDKPLAVGVGLNNGLNYRAALWTSFDYQRTINDHALSACALFSMDKVTIPRYSPYANATFAARANYMYRQRYILEGSYSYSGNDDYRRGDRFGSFYSVSAGWHIERESFMREMNNVNLFKVRASYGITGSNMQPYGQRRYLYQTQFVPQGGYVLGTSNEYIQGIYESEVGNRSYTWEKAKQFNVGFEGRFFENLYASFDYFTDHRFDILVQQKNQLPSILGAVPALKNIGKVNTWGTEITVGYDNVWGDLHFNAELGSTQFKNKVVADAQVKGLYSNETTLGKPSYGIWGLQHQGFFYDEADVANSKKQEFGFYTAGDVKYKDVNNDGVIDSRDVTRIGDSGIPEWLTSLRLTVGFKGFDLSALFVGSFGRSVVIPYEFNNALPYGGKFAKAALERWAYYTDPISGEVVDTRATAKLPRILIDKSNNNMQQSTLTVKDADYIRLRNIELGFTFPKKWCKALYLENVRIYGNGYNVALLYDQAKVGDPEYPAACIGGYGMSKVFSGGISITF